ncbi:ABC transporter permease subunit [Lacticaseibacillus daqingensis]|uniref:ABC transporter permease subunit n=1 Tax=Lacticaseibacillus daqingensis TaxID=2486014 RepID=UPI000F78C7EF|nr:ABC transporter permease subunit [Lacticaseibacillus daqingensis]
MAELTRYFSHQRRVRLLVFGTLLALLLLAQVALQLNVIEAATGVFAGWGWLVANFAPIASAFPALGEISWQLAATVLIAIAATMVAAGVALLLALAGARTTSHWPLAQALIRPFASIMRNIPFVAWALVLLFSFKQTPFTGFLALLLMSVGYLTRAFMETLDEVGHGVIEALEATGAGYWAIICQGVLPAAAAPLVSWLLYMIENNIRDATLVGMLTGTGVGFLFDLYFKSFRYPAAGLVVCAIILVTIAIELSATKLRQVLNA